MSGGPYAHDPVQARYHRDAVFHHFVDTIRALLGQMRLSPVEVREGAMLACVMHEERLPAAALLDGDGGETPLDGARD